VRIRTAGLPVLPHQQRPELAGEDRIAAALDRLAAEREARQRRPRREMENRAKERQTDLWP